MGHALPQSPGNCSAGSSATSGNGSLTGGSATIAVGSAPKIAVRFNVIFSFPRLARSATVLTYIGALFAERSPLRSGRVRLFRKRICRIAEPLRNAPHCIPQSLCKTTAEHVAEPSCCPHKNQLFFLCRHFVA